MNIRNPTEENIRRFYTNLNIGTFINQQLHTSLAILDHNHHTSLKDTVTTVAAFREFITQKVGNSWRHCSEQLPRAKDFADNYIYVADRVGNIITKSLEQREQWQQEHKHTLFDFRAPIKFNRECVYTDTEDTEDEKNENESDVSEEENEEGMESDV